MFQKLGGKDIHRIMVQVKLYLIFILKKKSEEVEV
jgi:hypothetical protein